jgi:hypothetical protein
MNTYFITISLFWIACVSVYTQTPVLPKSNPQNVRQHFNEKIASFRQNGNLSDMYEAERMLNNQQQLPIEDNSLCHIELIEAVIERIDPNYDTKTPPPIFTHVLPPPGYDSGIDPKVIKDAVQRADYERRIAENKARGQKHMEQVMLAKMKDDCVSILKNWHLKQLQGQPSKEKVTRFIGDSKLGATLKREMTEVIQGKPKANK